MPNQLAHQSSPYLLQHAENPVDWYPWCTEALMRAETEDKPIFLSIGYSACHWCHVMEHESFQNEVIAKLLNDNFISIKVDREERPDLDQIYMNAVMALRQEQGGWPLSAFLTPSREVFFGGTYWPPTSRMGMPGFDHVLHRVLDAFTNRREQVNQQSQQITTWLNQTEANESGRAGGLSDQALIDAAHALHANFDFQNGGFGSAPKFPHTMDLALLVRLSRRWPVGLAIERETLLQMVSLNLRKMAGGGIFDHLAGGFARYSVDEHWLVPHFEKMLYDNALLTGVYLDMYEETGDGFYAQIASQTLDYILRDLTDQGGGFHSTEDADSEGVEGKFYVWSYDEIVEHLGPDCGETFCRLYGVIQGGNFEGKNILNMPYTVEDFANKNQLDPKRLSADMSAARKKLLALREQRVRPALDDKVLVSWNSLAISAFARAAVTLNEERYAAAAANAAHFILDQLSRPNGRLYHTWRQGPASIDAYLDDYAYLVVALLDLYDVAQDPHWLVAAIRLTTDMIEHFSCEGGGFYFTADDQEVLIARSAPFQDNSIPSGNAMAAGALLRLGRLIGRTDWLEAAEKTIQASSSMLQRSPLASGQMLMVLDEHQMEGRVLVLADSDSSKLNEAIQFIRKAQIPATAILVHDERASTVEQLDLQKMLSGKICIDDQLTMYVCRGQHCDAPAVGLAEIKLAINRLANQTQPLLTPQNSQL